MNLVCDIEFEVIEEFYLKMFSRYLVIIFRGQKSGLIEDIDLGIVSV